MILLQDPLTPKEVAAETRVHYETVMRWIRAGTLPAFKSGREYRVWRADLERTLGKAGRCLYSRRGMIRSAREDQSNGEIRLTLEMVSADSGGFLLTEPVVHGEVVLSIRKAEGG